MRGCTKIVFARFAEGALAFPCGLSQLASDGFSRIITAMSAEEVIEQIKHLPPAERAQVAKFVLENDDSWIPAEFKQGMVDIAAGRVVDLDTALNELYPGDK